MKRALLALLAALKVGPKGRQQLVSGGGEITSIGGRSGSREDSIDSGSDFLRYTRSLGMYNLDE